MLPTSRARSNTFPVPYPQYVVHPTVLSVLYSLSLYPTLPINTLSPPLYCTPQTTPLVPPLCCVSIPQSLPPPHFITPGRQKQVPANWDKKSLSFYFSPWSWGGSRRFFSFFWQGEYYTRKEKFRITIRKSKKKFISKTLFCSISSR